MQRTNTEVHCTIFRSYCNKVFRELLHRSFNAMARKDATRSSPVDNYRKEIGKHDIKKDRKGLSKELKDKKDAKASAMSIQEVALVLVASLAVLVGLYLVFYIYLAQ